MSLTTSSNQLKCPRTSVLRTLVRVSQPSERRDLDELQPALYKCPEFVALVGMKLLVGRRIARGGARSANSFKKSTLKLFPSTNTHTTLDEMISQLVPSWLFDWVK